jgi:hypothetical protein
VHFIGSPSLLYLFLREVLPNIPLFNREMEESPDMDHEYYMGLALTLAAEAAGNPTTNTSWKSFTLRSKGTARN